MTKMTGWGWGTKWIFYNESLVSTIVQIVIKCILSH